MASTVPRILTITLAVYLGATWTCGWSRPVVGEAPEDIAAEDWKGIRASYEAGRHAVRPVEGGYRARNPGQQWWARFDGRGFGVHPDHGAWTWGLELKSYGFAEDEHDVSRPERVTAGRGRVAYLWDAVVEEWFVNDPRGLEHGFTVHRQPEGALANEERALSFTFNVRGGLSCAVAADGLGVQLLDRTGGVTLTYSGLMAFDADGCPLDARFEVHDTALRILVNQREARYPLTIDPIAQQAYIKASNTGVYDHFGASVSVSGNTIAVGAYEERSSSTGVNGDQSDNSIQRAGAVYVFTRDVAGWSQQAYLKASNTDYGDQFGWSVSVSGDTLVVGAPGEASSSNTVNGNQADNSLYSSGAAYVFVRSGTSWSQQAYLKASNTDNSDQFGTSVAVHGDFVLVGAPWECGGATGVNGNQADNSAPKAGAAYLFARTGTNWSQQEYLKASNTDSQDEFGKSVALWDDTLIVGAPEENSNATGLNGNQNDNSSSDAGAAYVFVRVGSIWSQQAYIKASNTRPYQSFGGSVSGSYDTIVVGSTHETSNATGVNGDQNNNSLNRAGAAYVFVRNGSIWSQQAYLKASNTRELSWFGHSVAVSGDLVLVSALWEDSGSKGVNGPQASQNHIGAGAAYLFVRSGTDWTQDAYLKASNTDQGDHFGSSVSVSGENVAIGAYGERSADTGVNGQQYNNNASHAGAVYAFEFDQPTSYCSGKTNSLGCVPFLAFSGMASATSTSGFQLMGTDMIPGEAGFLMYSFKKSNLTFHGGKLCVKLPFRRLALRIAKSTGVPPCAGLLKRNFNATIQGGGDPFLTPGQVVFTQWRQRDPADPFFTDSLTNGLRFTIQP